MSPIHADALLKGTFLLLFLQFFAISRSGAQAPDHVVMVIFENKKYDQLVGNTDAPYIKALLHDPHTAYFTASYALTHPSQPNYLMLFSGSAQGVTNDALPTDLSFTTPNLGASLIANNRSFTGYCEDLPAPGYTGIQNGLYERKHNPWVNWQDSPVNGIPASSNQPFTALPSDFADAGRGASYFVHRFAFAKKAQKQKTTPTSCLLLCLSSDALYQVAIPAAGVVAAPSLSVPV